jgi:death-on-curing protein
MAPIIWIEEREALALHNRLLALDGGAVGVRDAGLLASALARPRQIHAYGEKSDVSILRAPSRAHTRITLAAAYTAAIVRYHPFVDGNKRTGFVIGIVFLEVNGYRFTASEEDATQALFGLAAGTLDEDAFTVWLRANVTRVKGKK